VRKKNYNHKLLSLIGQYNSMFCHIPSIINILSEGGLSYCPTKLKFAGRELAPATRNKSLDYAYCTFMVISEPF